MRDVKIDILVVDGMLGKIKMAISIIKEESKTMIKEYVITRYFEFKEHDCIIRGLMFNEACRWQ